jgi:enoyl-CoA hydratase/carnithine racemase
MLLVGTGQTLTAEDAAAIGLFDVVFERADFEAGWRSIAADFAGLAPGAAQSIKHVIAAAKPHVHAALADEAAARFARLWIAEEHWTAHDRAAAERANKTTA